jgi:hypothetical protein
VQIDQPENGDSPVADAPAARTRPGGPETPAEPRAAATRAERNLDVRVRLDAAFRAYAIDLGCAQVEQIERKTVTPAMRQIEAADPERHLAGLEHRLKGRDRLSEKVNNHWMSRAEITVDQAFSKVKDAIRYTFEYNEIHYTEGVLTDIERLKGRFEVVDVRNSWTAEEYKGVNSRWRAPENGQVFEVQFHTAASREAKESTHWAYERIRSPETSREERSELQEYQRRVSADIPTPANVREIPDYP